MPAATFNKMKDCKAYDSIESAKGDCRTLSNNASDKYSTSPLFSMCHNGLPGSWKPCTYLINNQKIQNNGCQYQINEKCKISLRYRSAFAFMNILIGSQCSSQPREGINFTWKPLYWYPKNSGWTLLSSERQDLHEMAKWEDSIRPGNDTITAGHVHTYHT